MFFYRTRNSADGCGEDRAEWPSRWSQLTVSAECQLRWLPLTPLFSCRRQFTVKPDSMEKEVKLQLPVTLASYPYRNSDGTLRKKRGAHYPDTLPMARTPAPDGRTAA